MKKRTIRATVAVTAAVALLFTGFQPAMANTEIQTKLDQVREEQVSKQESANETRSEITELESELSALSAEIEALTAKQQENEQKLKETEEELIQLGEEIKALEEEIVIIEERIEERREILQERAVATYESDGEVSYLEVLLGAQSFGDFIERLSAITTIAQSDQELLDEHIADEERLHNAKQEVEAKKAKVEENKAALVTIKNELDSQKNELNSLQDDLNEKETQLQQELNAIISDEELLKGQEHALEAELAAWEEEQKKAREEEERRKQEEKERQERQEREAKQTADAAQVETASEPTKASTPAANAPSSREASPSTSGNNSVQNAAPAANNSSSFIRPATGSVTSQYGMRGGRMHWGIDIGKNGRSGDVPIVSVLDGTVVEAGYHSGGFGNWVLVTHQMNGQQYSTVYAHLDRIDVSAGQRVGQGTQLGTMGNTGNSFGAHLHFEVHQGAFNWSRSNAVDPMNYI
ncbi:murein hydrolase activator EnvC family protein [Shouchella miscanthi]|uniref:murein hydrolase activator EnvC family protein n=1 Tax=Shouchella miscanthi TaxID=2598861 RepID=UPI0011A81D66|nr:M23 family metallopeptidase [Shouchella miscanthi]